MAKRGPAAARPAGRVLADMRRQLDSGWPAGLTVLTGDDLFHLDRAQRLLVETLAPAESSEFALTVFGGDAVDASTIVAAARSKGMFDARRVVLVRDLQALQGDAESLASYASSPPPDSHLLVRAPVLDLRRKLHKLLADAGVCLQFRAASDAGRTVEDVMALAGERDLELDRQTAAFLAEACAGDLYRISTELAKMDAWLGGETARRVTFELSREVVATGGLMSGWEVADAVLARDRGGALAAARRLVLSGDEPIRIVGGLAWRARVMLQAKAMLARGVSAGQTVSATRAWPYREQLLAGLKRYSLSELLAFPRLLFEADRTLKSRSLQPGAVLEHLVDRMTADDRPSRPRAPRGAERSVAG